MRSRAVPGLHLDGALRLEIVREPRFSFGLRLNPGMELYFFNSLTVAFGLSFPIDLVFGAVVTRDLLLTVGLSLPMTLLFNPFAFLFPIQPGVGFEYRLDRNLSLTFDTRLGPTFATLGVGATGELSFRALFGAGYRF